MHIKKNRILILLSGFLLMFFVLTFEQKKVAAESQSNINTIIDLTGIMNDASGNSVIKGKFATREELAQILIEASPYKGEVESTSTLRLFKDVSKSDRSAAYIQIAVSKGYMMGYSKGMFKPKKAVTLKEAIYATLSLLGYTKEDFAGRLSQARYDTFQELGLGKNLTKKEEEKLTQEDCRNLFYNLLNAKKKTGETYGSILGYSLNENSEIDYDSLMDKKIVGPYFIKDGWENVLEKKLSSYTILCNGSEIKSSDIENNGVAYYSEQAKKIWIYNEIQYGTLESISYNGGEPQSITVAGTSYSIEKPANMKKIFEAGNMKKGTLAAIFIGRDNKVSYLTPIKTILADGNWRKELTFEPSAGVIYRNDNRVTVAAIKSYDMICYSNEMKTIWVFDKRVYGSMDNISTELGDPQKVTVSGKTYAIENPQNMKKELDKLSMQTGTPVVLLFGWDDKVCKILTLPSMVVEDNWESRISFNAEQSTIYKNGSVVSYDDINSGDVIYYCKELKSIWVYDKKIYGVLEAVSPSLSAPEAVTVAGNTYELKIPPVNSSGSETVNTDNMIENAWGNRLQENKIQAGDNIVLLFGYNGSVVDIRTVDKMPINIAGYALGVENKVVKNENQSSTVQQVVRIVDTEGFIREFPYSDSNIQKGDIAEVSFKDGKAILTKINLVKYTIPTDITQKKLAQDARMIEVKGSNYAKVTVATLKETSWSAEDVIYYKLNSKDEITDMILNNVTDSIYQFGMLKKVTISDSGYVLFTFDFGGSDTVFTVEQPKWNLNLGPKAVIIEDNELKDIITLEKVNISYIEKKQANTGDAVYRISDEALVYFYKNGEYYKGSLDDIVDFSNRNVYGYISQLQKQIEVIVVVN